MSSQENNTNDLQPKAGLFKKTLSLVGIAMGTEVITQAKAGLRGSKIPTEIFSDFFSASRIPPQRRLFQPHQANTELAIKTYSELLT